MSKSSPARLKANAKYAAKTYKRYAVNARLEFAAVIDDYCKTNNISNSGLFLAAVKYCLDNGVNLAEYQKTDIDKSEEP